MSKKTKKQQKKLAKALKSQHKLLKKVVKQNKKLHRQLRVVHQQLDALPLAAQAPHTANDAQPTRSQPHRAPVVSTKDRPGAPAPLRSGKYPSPYLRYKVASALRITPTMMSIRCIPAGGARVESQHLVGEYMRVLVSRDGSALAEPEFKGSKPVWGKPSPTSRKYTIRKFWPESGAIELGVVIHAKGPGTQWAQQVQPGDPVHLLGPRSGYDISDNYDFYLLAGDETGLPGMARWIESMPATARGAAYIEIPSAESEQEILAPDNFEVHWVIHETENSLYQAVSCAERPQGQVFMWLAGESRSIQPLRQWMRTELNLGKDHAHAKGYWKDKD
ncbi:siderophore-interacting protein [Rothia sp. ZJ1223]|uniref:siderophore-interacting protein n=1 Tax=Rothia sp. ZJ1223 TaxID=2811098 RepID=UPI0019572293|nr:siderophore-interacting protein [Rothia sp. ZJ1223]